MWPANVCLSLLLSFQYNKLGKRDFNHQEQSGLKVASASTTVHNDRFNKGNNATVLGSSIIRSLPIFWIPLRSKLRTSFTLECDLIDLWGCQSRLDVGAAAFNYEMIGILMVTWRYLRSELTLYTIDLVGTNIDGVSNQVTSAKFMGRWVLKRLSCRRQKETILLLLLTSTLEASNFL